MTARTRQPTFISIIHRRQRVIVGRNWSLKASDNLGNVVLVKFLNRYLKFQTFFTTNEKFSYLGASGMVLWSDLSHFPFLCWKSSRLTMNRLESIRREFAFVIVERDLSSRMPNLALFVGKIFPGKANDLRESAVVGLNLRRDVLTFNEGGTKENECIGRSWYVVYGLLSAVT